MRRQYRFYLGTLILATLVLIVPVVVRAQTAELTQGDIPLGKGILTFTAQVGGFAGRSGAVDASPNSIINFAWTVQGWKGCFSNWQSEMITGSGVMSRKVKFLEDRKSFTLVLTCAGIGQAQTAKVVVNIVKPDLSIVSFTGSATKVAPEAAIPGRRKVEAIKNANGTIIAAEIPEIKAIPAKPHKNEYYAGTVTFKTILRNGSKSTIPGNIGVTTRYSWANTLNSTNWIPIHTASLETSSGIEPGAIPNVVPFLHTAGVSTIGANGKPIPYYFKAEADSANVVKETSEDNNVKIIGPYIFVAQVK